MISYDKEKSEWVGEESQHREYAFTDMLSITTDYDGAFCLGFGSDGGFEADGFTSNERRALANIMIARWEQWAKEQR